MDSFVVEIIDYDQVWPGCRPLNPKSELFLFLCPEAFWSIMNSILLQVLVLFLSCSVH